MLSIDLVFTFSERYSLCLSHLISFNLLDPFLSFDGGRIRSKRSLARKSELNVFKLSSNHGRLHNSFLGWANHIPDRAKDFYTLFHTKVHSKFAIL